jgi:hypothetical protein
MLIFSIAVDRQMALKPGTPLERSLAGGPGELESVGGTTTRTSSLDSVHVASYTWRRKRHFTQLCTVTLASALGPLRRLPYST